MPERINYSPNIFNLSRDGAWRKELVERIEQVEDSVTLFNPGITRDFAEAYAAQTVFRGVAIDALTFTARVAMEDAEQFIEALNPNVLPEVRDEIAGAYVDILTRSN